MNNTLKQILGNTILLAIASILQKGIVIVIGIILSRRFGTEIFELFSYLHLTSMTFSRACMLGLMTGLPRFVARFNVNPSAESLLQVIFSLFIIIFGLSVCTFAIYLFPSKITGLDDQKYIILLIMLIFAAGANDILSGINSGLEKFTRVSVASMIMCLIALLGTGLAVIIDDYQYILYSYLLSLISSALYLIKYPVKNIRQPESDSESDPSAAFNAILRYISPMFLTSLLGNTALWIVGRNVYTNPPTADGYSIFTIAVQLTGLVQMFSTIIAKVLMPAVTKNYFQKKLSETRAILRSSVALGVIFCVVFWILFYFFGQMILALYGDNFRSYQSHLMVFLLIPIVHTAIPMLSSALIASENYNSILFATMVWWIIIFIGAGYSALITIQQVAYILLLANIAQLILLANSYKKANDSPA